MRILFFYYSNSQQHMFGRKINISINKLLGRQKKKQINKESKINTSNNNFQERLLYTTNDCTFEKLYQKIRKQKQSNKQYTIQILSNHSSCMATAKKNSPHNSHRIKSYQNSEYKIQDIDHISNRQIATKNIKSKTKQQKTNNLQYKSQKNTNMQYILKDRNQNKEMVKQLQKQIYKLIQHSHHQHIRQFECFLSQQQLINILKQTGYLHQNSNPQFYEDIWIDLKGQEYQGIPLNNLIHFLIIISSKQISIKQISSKISKQYIDQNLKFTINHQQHNKINHYYSILRKNRRNWLKSKKINSINNENNSQTYDCLFGKNIVQNATDSNQYKSDKDCNNNYGSNNDQEKSSNIQNNKIKILKKLSSLQTKISNSSLNSIINDNDKIFYENNKTNTQLHQEKNKQIPKPKQPIMSLDVNLGDGIIQKIVVCQNQTAHQVSSRLVNKYRIEQSLRKKFEKILDQHIKNMLWRIQQVSQQFLSDSSELQPQLQSLKQ